MIKRAKFYAVSAERRAESLRRLAVSATAKGDKVLADHFNDLALILTVHATELKDLWGITSNVARVGGPTTTREV